MASLISLLIIVTTSLIVTRVATIALTLTGLSRDVASFQALSAFSGVGFTTSEAENIVDHPVRRRIISSLMLWGNIGLVTGVASLLLTFVDAGSFQAELERGVLILAVLAVLWFLYTNNYIDRISTQVIRRLLGRYTELAVRDYAALLSISEGYAVSEMTVEAADWIAGRPLAKSDLADEGIIVLGIYREDGDYVGVPQGNTRIEEGDRLIMYGDRESLGEIDERTKGAAGDAEHRAGVAKQEQRVRDQQEQDQQDKPETENDQ